MIFFFGLHHPNRSPVFLYRDIPICISANTLQHRQSGFLAGTWMLDSGAFSQIERHGRYVVEPDDYAGTILRFANIGQLEVAVSQDYMCEPWLLDRTGLSIADHQRLTIERYKAVQTALWSLEGKISGIDGGVSRAPPLMPVLQGMVPADYAAHLDAYGDILAAGSRVGVGSICKRQGDPSEILAILGTIKARRPDLRLHGFGVKKTALAHPGVRATLYSADSMAWSYTARREGRDPNDPFEALHFARGVRALRLMTADLAAPDNAFNTRRFSRRARQAPLETAR